MNPKYKAKSLMDEFVFYLYLDISTAKKASLIVVDEMIENCREDLKDFWKEVKQEIEKL